MEKYLAPEATIEVAGTSLLAFIKNTRANVINPILAEVGIDNIDPDTWSLGA